MGVSGVHKFSHVILMKPSRFFAHKNECMSSGFPLKTDISLQIVIDFYFNVKIPNRTGKTSHFKELLFGGNDIGSQHFYDH